jgi:uncharacterized repeat protein (TIGR01451 family)
VIVNASEISFAPAMPMPGQNVIFRITVRNQGNGAAQRVVLALTLRADARVVNGPPMQFPLPPGGSHQAVWQTVMPPGQQVQFIASVFADGGTANNRAVITLPSGGGARARGSKR